MKIATWNVNSIRQRLSALNYFIKSEDPDIIMLQELKCSKDHFPKEEIKALGYNNISFKGQKAYNGVAIISKLPFEEVNKNNNNLLEDEEARYLEVTLEAFGQCFRLISIYVPQGQALGTIRFDYKMRFYTALTQKINTLLQNEEILLIGGDLNVAPENIDVYDSEKLANSMGFHLEEREKLRELLNARLTDAFRIKYPYRKEFSWWDYRGLGFQYDRGMRIDHILISPEGVDLLKDCYFLKSLRSQEKASDHIPVVAVF